MLYMLYQNYTYVTASHTCIYNMLFVKYACKMAHLNFQLHFAQGKMFQQSENERLRSCIKVIKRFYDAE